MVIMQTAGEVQGFQGEYDNKGQYEFEGAVWRGELITEGGGFCGARTKVCCLTPETHLALFSGFYRANLPSFKSSVSLLI